MRPGWNHNIEYHRLILASVPLACEAALDVGCGEGMLTRKLAVHAKEVIGLDIDPRIIAAARAGSASANLSFTVGDVMTFPCKLGQFSLICSVATLHHLPLEPALARFVELLRPGGVLAVIGLYRSEGVVDAACDAVGLLASQLKRRFYDFKPVAAATREPQQTLKTIRTAADRLLPGNTIRRHLYFRYSLVWRKPRPADSSS